MAKPQTDVNMEQQELTFIAGGVAKWYSHFGRQLGKLLTQLNVILPYIQPLCY